MDQVTVQTDFFIRNIGTITADQQQRLRSATVTVIGCGGLGGFVIEELVRLGIGTLRICDPDRFTASNINRQLYAGQETLGRFKAEVLAERARAIHDQTEVFAHTHRFQEITAQIFGNSAVVVDCLDTPAEKCELANQCTVNKIPLVHGAVFQWYGQVAVQLPPIRLLDDLYPPPDGKKALSPSVLSCTVGLVASLQVCEICKLLLDLPSSLHNSWMSIDLQRLSFDIINEQGETTDKPKHHK